MTTTRLERRLFAKAAKKLNAARPRVLTPIPAERFNVAFADLQAKGGPVPVQAWESQNYHAQLYPEQPVEGRECLRLSIGRSSVRVDGQFDDNLSWDELMQVKRQTGFADWYALEVYPPDEFIVNVANLRHLWLFGEPWPLGWLRKPGELWPQGVTHTPPTIHER